MPWWMHEKWNQSAGMISRSSSYRCLQKQIRREALAGNACPMCRCAALVMLAAAKVNRCWERSPIETGKPQHPLHKRNHSSVLK